MTGMDVRTRFGWYPIRDLCSLSTVHRDEGFTEWPPPHAIIPSMWVARDHRDPATGEARREVEIDPVVINAMRGDTDFVFVVSASLPWAEQMRHVADRINIAAEYVAATDRAATS